MDKNVQKVAQGLSIKGKTNNNFYLWNVVQ